MIRAILVAAIALLGCAAAREAQLTALVRTRLDEAARHPVVKFDLGVPMPTETPETRDLVAMGARIVPVLIQLIEDVPAQQATYAAIVLGRLGDVRAEQPLERLRVRYQAKPSPDPWDQAVAGQCNAALQALRQAR